MLPTTFRTTTNSDELTLLRCSIDGARGVLLIEVLRIGSAAAVVAALRPVRRDAAFRPDVDICIDCTSLDWIPRDGAAHTLARECVAQLRGGLTGRCAIVARPGPMSDAARMFLDLAARRRSRTGVFGSLRDAMAWLEQPPSRAITESHETVGEDPLPGDAHQLLIAARRAGLGRG